MYITEQGKIVAESANERKLLQGIVRLIVGGAATVKQAGDAHQFLMLYSDEGYVCDLELLPIGTIQLQAQRKLTEDEFRLVGVGL